MRTLSETGPSIPEAYKQQWPDEVDLWEMANPILGAITPIMITMTQMLMSTKNGSKEKMDGTKCVEHFKNNLKNVPKQS